MKNKNRMVLYVVLLLAMYVSSCAPMSTPIPPTLTLQPTQTAIPTSTNTITPIPTETPIPPTSTIPAPDLLNEYFENPKVVYFYDFSTEANEWKDFEGASIVNGALEMGTYSRAISKRNFKGNIAVLLNFTYASGSNLEIELVHGETIGVNSLQFAIFINKNQPIASYAFEGMQIQRGYFSGDLSLKPDTVYSMLLTSLPNGEFMAIIWDPMEPSKRQVHRRVVNEEWANQDWALRILSIEGYIIVDDYKEISFDQVK